jgi:c-di-GMP-binding flagellar brake protein YcgR
VEERRKFKRLRYGVQVEISYYRKKPGDTDIIRKLKTKDISAGGIRVALKDKLEEGSLVSIRLVMPDTGRDVTCFAQVAWVAAETAEGFETGFAFMDISNQEMTVIQEFIETELEKGIE